MTIDDTFFAEVTEGAVLKFTLALYELEHPGTDALKVATNAIRCDKGALVQHRDGKGSIGVEGWELLGSHGFDLRGYDTWIAAKRKQYRGKR